MTAQQISPHIDPIDLMSSFAAAGSALRELPKAIADRDAAMALVDETNGKLHATENKVSYLLLEIERLKFDATEREAALSDATKSRDDANAALEGIRSVLGTVASVVSRTADEVSVLSEASTPAQQASTQQNHNPEPVASEASTTHNPDDSPFIERWKSEWNHPEQRPAPETSSITEPPHSLPTHDQSSPHTSITTSPQLEPPHETSHATNDGSLPSPAQEASELPPFAGMGYLDKPYDMTWATFQSEGGRVPYWVTDMSATA